MASAKESCGCVVILGISLSNIALRLIAAYTWLATTTRQAKSLDQLATDNMLEKSQLADTAYALTPEFSKQDCFTCLRLEFPIKPLRWADRDKRSWADENTRHQNLCLDWLLSDCWFTNLDCLVQ